MYEDVCREKLWELNAAGELPFLFSKIGRYWNSKTEIDIVVIDPEGGNIILGECKYWGEPVGINVLNDLETKTKDVDWRRESRKVWYVLIGVNRFTGEFKELAKTRNDILLIK